MLAQWSGTRGKRMLKRMWINPTHSFSAVTIIKRKRGYGFIVMSPDGQLMDVGVCRYRSDAKAIIQKLLDEFIEECGIPHADMSPNFRDWLY